MFSLLLDVLIGVNNAGGGMAQLAAIWAAVSWTQTQIRCITFGAPPVSRTLSHSLPEI